ncbi:MAG: MaoC family dehydratase [Rhodospirillaceae bacterium]
MDYPTHSSAQTLIPFENLSVGMSASVTRPVTEMDVFKFADVSGDSNPIHLDEECASASVFKTRVAHGMLTASFISAVLGTKLPGSGAIYVNQSLKFKAPVKIGDRVTTRVEVAEKNPDRNRVTFKTQCFVGDKLVVDGEAMLMVPGRD